MQQRPSRPWGRPSPKPEGGARLGTPGKDKSFTGATEGALEGVKGPPGLAPGEIKDGAGEGGAREDKGPAFASGGAPEGTPGKGTKGGKDGKASGAEEGESAPSPADGIAKKLRSPSQASKGPAKAEEAKASASPGPSPSKSKRARAQQHKEAEAQKLQQQQQQQQAQQQQQQQQQQPKLLMSQILKAAKPARAMGTASPPSATAPPSTAPAPAQPLPHGGPRDSHDRNLQGAKEQPLPSSRPAPVPAPVSAPVAAQSRPGLPWELGAGKVQQKGGGMWEALGAGAVGQKRAGEPSAWSRSVAEAAGLDPNLFVEVPGKKGGREAQLAQGPLGGGDRQRHVSR